MSYEMLKFRVEQLMNNCLSGPSNQVIYLKNI